MKRSTGRTIVRPVVKLEAATKPSPRSHSYGGTVQHPQQKTGYLFISCLRNYTHQHQYICCLFSLPLSQSVHTHPLPDTWTVMQRTANEVLPQRQYCARSLQNRTALTSSCHLRLMMVHWIQAINHVCIDESVQVTIYMT